MEHFITIIYDMETKKISIKGISNKYQMKKLTQERKVEKERTIIQTWNIPEEDFEFDKQLGIIKHIQCLNQNKEAIYDFYKLFVQEIEKKIYGYRQQDLIKSILNPEKFITITFVIDQMVHNELKCHYCKNEMFILYKNIREPKQWTIDRINNCNGHNMDNCVLSCLECNLKRRNTNKDNFLFTKQLNITRENYSENNSENYSENKDVNNIII